MKKGITVLLVLLVALTGTIILAAGCSSSETPQQAKQKLTSSLEGLKTSLQAFTNPATYTSTDSIKTASDAVKKQYDAVVKAAKDVKNVSTSTLTSAWDQLEKSIKNLSGSQSLTDKAASVESAVLNFEAAWQEVFSSAQSQ